MSNIELTPEYVKVMLANLSNPNNETRKATEEILLNLRYDKKLYEIFFHLIVLAKEDRYTKLQSLLTMKSILRSEVFNKRTSNNSNDFALKAFQTIIEYLKVSLVSILDQGHCDETLSVHIKEIIVIISDNHFPHSWPELNDLFCKIYTVRLENITHDLNSFSLLCSVNELFYSVVKKCNKKRTPLHRQKFLQLKNTYHDLFRPFYDMIHSFFVQNSAEFSDMDFIIKFLGLMMDNDKIILLLIDSFFNPSDFHKDEKLLQMVTLILDRAYFLLNQIENLQHNSSEILEVLHKNLFKIIKYLGKIQSSNPVIFYKELERYVNILMLITINCNYFKKDTVKAVLFSLNKVISTVSYKELTESNSRSSEGLSKTPEKGSKHKQRMSVNHLVSPTKFKNFETELQVANDKFAHCFRDEILRNLLENLIKKLPFVFHKEIENLEIELIADIEEELIPLDKFSSNTVTWQAIYKNILEGIVINFTEFSLKFIREILQSLYNGETNILLIDSIVTFVNILPGLYKQGIIKEADMIDPVKFMCYLESFVNQSEVIIKRYIVTISKWADIFISNETIFTYIDNLMLFLTASKNNLILIETCLSLKTIINHMDLILKGKSEGYLNLLVDKEKLKQNIKGKVNWSNILSAVSGICLHLLPQVKSTELLSALVSLFTGLIEKCHYQCDGRILQTIKNSKIIDIIENIKEEFCENIFIEMWKSLLVSFPNSTIIADLTLQFISRALKRDMNMNNLGLLLFTVKILQNTDEIRSLLINFLKDHIILFRINTKQYLSLILFNTLEEFVLFDLFDYEDIVNIINLCQEKYFPLYQLTKELYDKHMFETKNNLTTTESTVYHDFPEYKSSIISVLCTILNFFYNCKDMNITEQYRIILKLLIDECMMSIEGPNSIFTNTFMDNILSLVLRVSVMNFEMFQSVLQEYLNQNNISFERFVCLWISRMEQDMSADSSKINVIFISKLLPLLDRNTFIQCARTVCDICVLPVHREMFNKLYHKDNMNDSFKLNGDSFRMGRTLNVRQSTRKTSLSQNDFSSKLDIHNLFVENFKTALNNNAIDYNELCQNILQNFGIIRRLDELFGINKD